MPFLLVALCTAKFPNRITLTIATLAWVLIDLFLLDVFKTINVLDSSPDFVRYLQIWASVADTMQVLATLGSAIGLWLLWAGLRTSKD